MAKEASLIRSKYLRPSTALILTILALSTSSAASGQTTYRAGVYAHAAYIPRDLAPVTRTEALKTMNINLNVYKNVTVEAMRQGVQILVFPEDGVYGMVFNRQTIYPYLEYMPDPFAETWNPCNDPSRYKDTEVQVALSCMAKHNNLYLVANIGDKQPCDPSNDPTCPKEKRYQYNTDVAYGPDGTFLAKYHKVNLYKELQFDTPAPRYVYFDTPFGRFGMMTCFDVLFEEPAISLAHNYNVTNIAFPTAWMDSLPVLSAIGFHSSFARAHGVNLLSANIHHPSFRFVGSGLYGPAGSHGVYYQPPSGTEPKLVVGDLDILKERRHPISSTNSGLVTPMAFNQSLDAEFSSRISKDMYTLRTLDQPSGPLKVCQGQVCCELDYEIEAAQFNNTELYAFGVLDGLHPSGGRDYYMQNCIMIKCANASDKYSCGKLTMAASTTFTKILMRGQFQTKYVYPEIISTNSDGQLGIYEPGVWSFDGTSLKTRDGFKGTILNAILVGRCYSRDGPVPSVNANDPLLSPGDSGAHAVISLLLLICSLAGAKSLV